MSAPPEPRRHHHLSCLFSSCSAHAAGRASKTADGGCVGARAGLLKPVGIIAHGGPRTSRRALCRPRARPRGRSGRRGALRRCPRRVFRLMDGNLELVADRPQDTMGFAVVGPRHFPASGHPAPTELDRPNHLGPDRFPRRSWDLDREVLVWNSRLPQPCTEPRRALRLDSVSATVMRTTDHNLDRGDAWGGPRASPPTPATPTRC